MTLELPSPPERPNPSRTPGAVRFARFAFAPNELGLCGPDAARSLFEHARDGIDDAELRHLAQGFEGAWPWLGLLADGAGSPDPLARSVVDAYWVGGAPAARIRPRDLDDHLRDRFRARTRPADWRVLRDLPGEAAPVHHSLHVLAVMPRVGLMRGGPPPDLVGVMGRCLVRPARIVALDGAWLEVEARALAWIDARLQLGPPRRERIRRQVEGSGFVDSAVPGDLVAVHWGWACDRLSEVEGRALLDATEQNLTVATRAL